MIRVMPNRRSGLNVGLRAHSRPSLEGCRRSQFDPKLPFGAGFKRGSPSTAMSTRMPCGNYRKPKWPKSASNAVSPHPHDWPCIG